MLSSFQPSPLLACKHSKTSRTIPCLVKGKTQIQTTARHGKKNWEHVGLHRSSCYCADVMMQYTQFGCARIFGARDSLEKCWNRMLYSESVGILWLDETKTFWQEKCVGKLRWHVYEFSGAWDSPLECWIASTIAETWKPAKRIYPQHLDGTNDTKASSWVVLMFWVHEIHS